MPGGDGHVAKMLQYEWSMVLAKQHRQPQFVAAAAIMNMGHEPALAPSCDCAATWQSSAVENSPRATPWSLPSHDALGSTASKGGGGDGPAARQ